MNQLLLNILLQFATAPLQQSTFPLTYQFYEGAKLEYANEYVWESPRSLIIKRHSAEDGDSRSVVSLNGKFQAVSDSIFGENGALDYIELYEYSGEKLSARRGGSDLARFFYDGEELDSVLVTRSDTVSARYRYAYDSQARPIEIDHFYSKDGGPGLDHMRAAVSYLLPDSIVIKWDFIPADGDSVRETVYLKDGLPIIMAEREYYSGSVYQTTHVWTYAGYSPIRPGATPKPQAIGSGLPWFRGYDLLGRIFRTAR